MAQITAALVKQLREKTGAGMMDAKKALVENDGDEEAAIEWLRAKGLSKAAKKSGRTAADGLVAVKVSEDGKSGAIVELNAETDFVARNETFQKAVAGITAAALDTDGSVAAVAAAPAPDGQGTVDDMIKRLIASIGENMTLRRSAKITANGKVASYIHNAETAGMGKVGVLVALEGTGDLDDIGRKIAMHIAATSPAAATTAELDPVLIETEKRILTEQARESGKPDNIIENMIKGRLQKFYKEVVLVEQPFVMNPDQTVAAYLKDQGATLVGFVHFKLGEGIEKDADNFADEVASLTKGG
ncbi:translation elongation factor Ts [Hyphomonas johnsonii]|jgi:elongation factor Ts|uniref:Elongation factor Ts n=1 Tax=Hyphomonas johnsonii MHS-2 TaxID=1280950 RepID=A0A059FV24_9PROT|nr:translation elongation factor Ts [Hyphomonas johnsonii]KCZ94371.1 translation elongation factor Ts [Hyphomonas johnsonii MHS-2]